jgi:hypothetical protein
VEPVSRKEMRARIDQAAPGLAAAARGSGSGLGADVHVRE